MLATPIFPIESMHGSLTPGYYCRMVNGRLVIQRKPCRQGHIPTPREAANQRRFALLYRIPKPSLTSGRPLGDHSTPSPSPVNTQSTPSPSPVNT